ADPDATGRILKFAADNGLNAEKVNAITGQIILEGKVGDFCKAFGVTMNDYKYAHPYKNGPAGFRYYSGLISVPVNIATDVQGVFAVDSKDDQPQPTRPSATSSVGPGQ